MNYSNRVKGNRPVGAKVFMQGGVCYNRAVPLAMAGLIGKPIIVPPEPGLMGAYGVALAVKKRIETGLMQAGRFDLEDLAERDVKYGSSFTCKGGHETCDRRCEIAIIELAGKKYPFGGACNRYYNLRNKVTYDVAKLDLVRVRQHLIFKKYGQTLNEENGVTYRGRIGLNRSFMVHTYYPLYATFFKELGFKTVLPDVYSQAGIDQRCAPFCYPGELSHGFFHTLLHMADPPDFIFLPHFKALPVTNGNSSSQVCPFVQGETFYLQTTFREKLDELERKGTRVLTPLLNFSKGLENAKKPLIETARQIGMSRKAARVAFEKALQQYKKCATEMQVIGKKALAELEAEPAKIGVVIFARPYNGFVEEAHMGIPHKLASRGVRVIPLDFLMLDAEKSRRHMYWGMGQLILKAARVVQKHPQLFGTFITNFSCGPDSFLIGYFRELMGAKPSLTLELDSHTADAGLETRIEAFLDIVTAYRQLLAKKKIIPPKRPFISARTELRNGVPKVITPSGESLPMNDPRVTFLLPSMGRLATEALTATFRGAGFNAKAHPPADEAVLKLGRANTSCKECLPLILTTGTLLSYIHNGRRPDEVLVYFMLTGSGPCRFGQYYIFMEDLVKRLRIPNVALFSLSSENSYAGLGNGFYRKAWWGVIVSDVMEDIRSMILANAVDVETAMDVFNQEWALVLTELERGSLAPLEKQLARTAERFSRIPKKLPIAEVPTISLTGEIFVRRDSLSRRYLMEYLAAKGFASLCAPIAEWLHYSDYLVEKNLVDYTMSMTEKFAFISKRKIMARDEACLKSILSRSGLVHTRPLNIKTIINNAIPFISANLAGEAILTVGASLTEVVSHTCGVIAIGPFGCMPNRMSEAILNETMNCNVKLALNPKNVRLQATLDGIENLPFLAIESDGSPFPQVITAKLETFCLRAERLHSRMLASAKEL
jgi:predicted nucleotide-binding protein (sugar kinase/HSP70/actin superfamily)